jgi:hypothetical protein
MVHVDGTERHTHDITNFKPNNGSAPIVLQSNGTTMISGTADITLNGTTKWTGVNVLISIEKQNAMSIVVSSATTDNHFKGQAIYGVVDSLQQSGTTTSSTSATSVASNAAGNITSTLNNLGKGISNLFSGNKTK